MNEWQALSNFFVEIWAVLDTEMDIPFIGITSPLKLMIIFATMGLIIDLVSGLISGRGNKE